MFIAVFNDTGDICMINSILRKHINTIRFYKGVLYRLGKGFVEDGLEKLF